MLTLATEDATKDSLKTLAMPLRRALMQYYRFPLAGFTDRHLALMQNCTEAEATDMRESLQRRGMVHHHGEMFGRPAYAISVASLKVMHSLDPNRKSKNPVSRNVHFPRSGT